MWFISLFLGCTQIGICCVALSIVDFFFLSRDSQSSVVGIEHSFRSEI